MTPTERSQPTQNRAIATRLDILAGASRVFARSSYRGARVRDIAIESGTSEGAVYFHYRGKQDIASAVVAAQQDRMSQVLTTTLAQSGDGLSKLIASMTNLGALISSDEIVQGGIVLANEPGHEVSQSARGPYLQWMRITETLLVVGVQDGSIRPTIDIGAVAEFLNYAFVGTQVLSGLSDGWTSLPARMEVTTQLVRQLLAVVIGTDDE